MPTVTIRSASEEHIAVLVDGRIVLTSSLEDDGSPAGETPLSVATAVRHTAVAVARALGADVHHETPETGSTS